MPSRTKEQNKKHYREYQSRPDVMKRRAQANKARRMMERAGKVHKGDGKDVHHVKPQSKGGKSTKGNLKVVSRAKNRGYKRGPDNRPK